MPDPAAQPADANPDARADVSDLAVIEISKEYLNFSAGHFTLFSASERENLHGHNWRVACDVTTPVGPGGLCFDYNIIKRQLMALCEELDEKVLLPSESPWLEIEPTADGLVALHGGERIPFLARDVLTLAVRNVTVEELAGWFIQRLLAAPEIAAQDVHALCVRVSSGTNQWASRQWRRT